MEWGWGVGVGGCGGGASVCAACTPVKFVHVFTGAFGVVLFSRCLVALGPGAAAVLPRGGAARAEGHGGGVIGPCAGIAQGGGG